MPRWSRLRRLLRHATLAGLALALPLLYITGVHLESAAAAAAALVAVGVVAVAAMLSS